MNGKHIHRTAHLLAVFMILTAACSGHTTAPSAAVMPRPWTIQHGTAFHDAAFSVAVQQGGRIVAAGSTYGGLDGQENQDPRGPGKTSDLFIIAFDSFGTMQWSHQLGSEYDDKASAIAADGGGLYVAGCTRGGLDGYENGDPYGPGGTYDFFVVKFDVDGTRQWTRQLGTSDEDCAKGIAPDGSGHLYVAGVTLGSLDGLSAGRADLFVAKYDTDGNLLWLRQLGTAANDSAAGVAVANGVISVVGTTYGGLDGMTSQGNADVFIVQYDADGVRLQTVLYGTQYADYGVGVAMDEDGNVYATGSTQGSLDGYENSDPRGPGWTSDLFVVKFDADGSRRWTQQLGTAVGDFGVGISLDGAASLYVTGSTQGGLDGYENSDPRGPGWTSDLLVVKFDTDGSRRWTRQLGTVFADLGRSIGVEGTGAVFVAGETFGGLDGHSNADASHESADIIIVKYDADGREQ